MKKYIAFSGGVESTAMCILYGKDAIPIFTDTGWEHKPLYNQIDRVEKMLKVLHGEEFHVIRIQAKQSLPDYIRQAKFFPGFGARYCTRMFKIEPMDEFLEQQGPCEVMIGLNWDEADEREGNYGKVKTVKYTYPLVDDQKTRGDCVKLLNDLGLHPNFPPYMNRGGCKGCYFKSKTEFKAMALLNPEEAYELAELEESIQDNRDTYYGMRVDIKKMRDFIDSTRSQELLFGLDEIYKDTGKIDGKGCGVFCHR